MKKSVFGWIILVLAALVVVFSLVSFRLMRSQTAAQSQVASSHTGVQDGPINFQSPAIGLSVQAEPGLQRKLQAEITRRLQGMPGSGQVRLVDRGVERADFPLLIVAVKEQNKLWTPVYARSELQVEISYASNGEVYFAKDAVPHFRIVAGQPALQFKGQSAINDVSWGLISMPGYHDFLVEKIAAAVQSTLQDQIAAVTG